MPAISDQSIAAIIADAVDRAVAGVKARLEREIAAAGAQQPRARPRAAGDRGGGAARPRARTLEMTRWVADRRARRVPTFVIEMTGGLDTKKKIVARYGEDAVFEKGKPTPKPAR